MEIDKTKTGLMGLVTILALFGGTLYFDCDGSPMNVNSYEPDGEWDENDVQSVVRKGCSSGVVTNIKMNEVYYRKDIQGRKAFDIEKYEVVEVNKTEELNKTEVYLK